MSITTGGLRSRDIAQILHLSRDYPAMTGQCGSWSMWFDAGGPIDAPETMPAGSVNNYQFSNGRGKPCVHASELPRAD